MLSHNCNFHIFKCKHFMVGTSVRSSVHEMHNCSTVGILGYYIVVGYCTAFKFMNPFESCLFLHKYDLKFDQNLTDHTKQKVT